MGFCGEFSGRITKIEICRLAAYLNHGVQRIGHKGGLPLTPGVRRSIY
jgi:hypothetical protein